MKKVIRLSYDSLRKKVHAYIKDILPNPAKIQAGVAFEDGYKEAWMDCIKAMEGEK